MSTTLIHSLRLDEVGRMSSPQNTKFSNGFYAKKTYTRIVECTHLMVVLKFCQRKMTLSWFTVDRSTKMAVGYEFIF
jgi:hypothetical protein